MKSINKVKLKWLTDKPLAKWLRERRLNIRNEKGDIIQSTDIKNFIILFAYKFENLENKMNKFLVTVFKCTQQK